MIKTLLTLMTDVQITDALIRAKNSSSLSFTVQDLLELPKCLSGNIQATLQLL